MMTISIHIFRLCFFSGKNDEEKNLEVYFVGRGHFEISKTEHNLHF